jgi:hypothetical protein
MLGSRSVSKLIAYLLPCIPLEIEAWPNNSLMAKPLIIEGYSKEIPGRSTRPARNMFKTMKFGS